MAETDFNGKARILGDLWMDYRDEEAYQDFVEFNDLGLPLAYAYTYDLISKLSEAGKNTILETWDMLLLSLEIEEDTGYESFDDLLSAADEDTSEEEEEEEEEEVEDTTATESYESGFNDGSAAEQKRVQEICQMQMTWAKQSNKGNDFMQWHNVSELLKPINFEYSEEKYYEDLKNQGF